MVQALPGHATRKPVVVPARPVRRHNRGETTIVPSAPTALLVLGMLVATLAAVPVFAQGGRLSQRSAAAAQLIETKHNENAPMILGGRPGTSYAEVANDMRTVLPADGGVRVVVVDTPGGIDTLRDLTLLRGIDLAIVPSNVLSFADRTGALGSDLKARLSYVAALYGEEVHVLAGPGVTSFDNLAGKTVAVPPDDGNAEFTARDLLRSLHVEAEVVKVGAIDAIDDLQSGTLGALVLVGGKPSHFVSALSRDRGLHLLNVPQKSLGEEYSPSNLSADDYPTLIPPTKSIETVSVGIEVLARRTPAADDSHHRVAKFVPAFFRAVSDLTGQRWHPKWSEVNLAATLPGWSRVPEAQDWLATALREQSDSVEKQFDNFLRTKISGGQPPSPATRQRLFKEYLEWTHSTTTAPR